MTTPLQSWLNPPEKGGLLKTNSNPAASPWKEETTTYWLLICLGRGLVWRTCFWGKPAWLVRRMAQADIVALLVVFLLGALVKGLDIILTFIYYSSMFIVHLCKWIISSDQATSNATTAEWRTCVNFLTTWAPRIISIVQSLAWSLMGESFK